MAWQWSNLERVLDPWFVSQSHDDTRSRVLNTMATMAAHPDDLADSRVPGESPLVRQLAVLNTKVVLVYLRAEQFHTFRLLAIADNR